MMRRLVLAAIAALTLLGAPQARAGEGFVTANGLKFHYVDEGSGPPLLLIHGGSLTLKSWAEMTARASAKFHVYAYDTRGHGATENPSGRYSYELLASDAAAIIDALHLDHPLVAGYSDGGITALLLAIDHPGLPRAVVVGGATGKVAASPHYFAGMRSFFGTGRAGHITDADLDALTASHPEVAAFYGQIHWRDGNTAYWRTLLKQIWPMWTTRLIVSPSQLGTIKAPMLVILADHDDFFDARDAVSLRNTVRGSQLAILPGATHRVFHDRAAQFDGMVLDFLDSHK